MADLNPIGDVLDCYRKIDNHLRDKTDSLIDKMHQTADQSKDITELENTVQNIMLQIDESKKNKNKDELSNIVQKISNDCEVSASLDNKNILSIDLEGTRWQAYIDKLYDAGKLMTRKYKFEGNEIENFRRELEQQKSILKNETSGPMLLIQPLLNLIELFANMAKKCVELDEKQKEKANNIR